MICELSVQTHRWSDCCLFPVLYCHVCSDVNCAPARMVHSKRLTIVPGPMWFVRCTFLRYALAMWRQWNPSSCSSSPQNASVR